MYEAMSTISWSYSAAGAGDAKASPAEACTMVVENARAVLCREKERLEEEKEDLAACWATNLLELRSGALTMLLRAAALAKLRLAMALIVRRLRSLLEGEGGRETTTALQRLLNGYGGRKWVVVEERELLKPMVGSGAPVGNLGAEARGSPDEAAWIACCQLSSRVPRTSICADSSKYPYFLKPKCWSCETTIDSPTCNDLMGCTLSLCMLRWYKS
jgi:hypothetical protein